MRKRWYQNLDWVTVLFWGTLVAVGLTAIYSATHGSTAAEYLFSSVQRNFQRQLVWLVICVVELVIILSFSVRFWKNMAYPIYIVSLLLVASTLVFGRVVNGAKSWIYFGGVGLQPAEFAKIGTLLAVAYLVSHKRHVSETLRYALIAVGLLLIPTALILLQNDTGTALVFMGLIPFVLFWIGLPLPLILLFVAPAVVGYFSLVYWPAAIGIAVLVSLGIYLATRDWRITGWTAAVSGGTFAVVLLALNKILNPNQVLRIAAFINPEADPHGSGYQTIQAKIAIGSGGVWGKGFGQGTQTQQGFVPEESTDFIYCVIGEEFGFIGAAIVLVLFGLLLLRIVTLGLRTKNLMAYLFMTGVAGVFLIHLLVNVGMTVGLMPVIGIPLPFVSYGGSALLANTAMLGLVLNFYMRRNEFNTLGF